MCAKTLYALPRERPTPCASQRLMGFDAIALLSLNKAKRMRYLLSSYGENGQMVTVHARLLICFASIFLAFRAEALIRSDRELSRFDEIWSEVDRQSRLYGPESVLLVVDLDNTILRSRNLLGSYPWFKWQEKLILSKASPAEGRVTDSMAELFHIAGLLFSYGSMELSEASLPQKLKGLRQKGVRILCLTARSPSYWEATLRDVQKNGLSFASEHWVLPELAYERDFYSAAVLRDRFQLGDEAIKNYGLLREARVMLRDGVFFSSGLHKGTLLQLALKLRDYKPKALVFVDDSEGNLASLRDVYRKEGPDVFLYRYARYDAELNALAQDKRKQAEARKLWTEWQSVLQSQDAVAIQAFLQRHFQ